MDYTRFLPLVAQMLVRTPFFPLATFIFKLEMVICQIQIVEYRPYSGYHLISRVERGVARFGINGLARIKNNRTNNPERAGKPNGIIR